MNICILCNISSEEKGISINSAKIIFEILDYFDIKEISIVLMEKNKEDLNFFLLDKKFIYSNTIEDFFFLYEDIYKNFKINNYIEYFKNFNYCFLTTHGKLGEDGFLQKILESNSIPYIGPSEFTSKNTFYKLEALKKIWKIKIFSSWFCEIYTNFDQIRNALKKFSKLILKPNNSGSSLEVHLIDKNTSEEKINTIIEEFKKKEYEPIIEEFHEGKEFSFSIINGKIYDITEIVTEDIFSYKKKYLSSSEVIFNHPAKFKKNIIEKIKKYGKKIYDLFKCNFFLRIDGFLKKNNQIIFTDFNSIPGFQINGLFFKNKDHFKIMKEIIPTLKVKKTFKNKKKIAIIFGGNSSEKNISIASGNNIIFNLRKLPEYEIFPFLFYKKKFFSLSYEECFKNSIEDFKEVLKKKKNISMKNFCDLCKKENMLIFMGLHGGIGEDGTLQKIFTKNNLLYTGSNELISKICMNKYLFNNFLKKINIENNYILNVFLLKNFAKISLENLKKYWIYENKAFIKPNHDGCSVGAMILHSFKDLLNYQKAVENKYYYYNNTLMSDNSDYILSEYIETDKIEILDKKISYQEKTFWLEGTIGVLEENIFSPSICLTNSQVLTMEEKFLQGYGVNITEIPNYIWNENDILIIKKAIKKLISSMGINTYCRIDFFYSKKSKKICIFEINTLPALTSSTVLFTQAMKLNIFPKDFLNKIINICYKK